MAATQAPAATIDFHDEIELKSSTLTLGAVADMTGLPPSLRKRAVSLELLTLPSMLRDVTIDRARLASRARSLFPALAPWLPAVTGMLRVKRSGAGYLIVSAQCGNGMAAGETIAVNVDGGWFRVEREVRTLQKALPDRHFFARTAEGQVLQAFCRGNG